MLLAEIDEGRDKEDYLLSVLATLGNSFIRNLHITDGRLYAEDQGRFLPMNVVDGGKRVRASDKRPLDSEAARLVVENGTYIYNDPSMTINKQTSMQGNH